MVLNLDFLEIDRTQHTTNLTAESNDSELCLRFNVPSGNEFALIASGVREVMSVFLDRITPIPNASPFFLGTYNWRGQVIWVADLGQFLGDLMVVDTNQKEVSLLIVEEQELVMGFAVHTVANTEWLNLSQIQTPDLSTPTAMSGFIKGVYPTTGTTPDLKLLDRVAILRSSQWTI